MADTAGINNKYKDASALGSADGKSEMKAQGTQEGSSAAAIRVESLGNNLKLQTNTLKPWKQAETSTSALLVLVDVSIVLINHQVRRDAAQPTQHARRRLGGAQVQALEGPHALQIHAHVFIRQHQVGVFSQGQLPYVGGVSQRQWQPREVVESEVKRLQACISGHRRRGMFVKATQTTLPSSTSLCAGWRQRSPRARRDTQLSAVKSG